MPRAEMWALLDCLQCTSQYGPHEVIIHTDSQIVYDGYHKEPKINASDGETWCEIHECKQKMHDAGWDITLRKVKAHTSLEDIDQDVINQSDRHGNALADYWARQGAAIHDMSERADLNKWVDSQRGLYLRG